MSFEASKNSLVASRNEILRCYDSVPTIQSKGTSMDHGEWTDDNLATLLDGMNIPLLDDDARISAVERFFNFYFSGNIPAGDTCDGTIVEAILLFSTLGGQMIPENTTGKDWYKPNTSTNGFRTGVFAEFEAISHPEALVGDDEIAKYDSLMGTYSGASLGDFQQVIADRIQALKVPGANLRSRENFQTFQYTALLAMVTLRALSKDEISVRNAYSKKQFRLNLSSLIGIDGSEAFNPPCKAFIKSVFTSFSSGSSTSRKCVALLVRCLIQNTGPSCDSYISGVLTATCLMHLCRAGLGLTQLLAQACEASQQSWKTLLRYTYMEQTKETWVRLIKFLRKVLTTDPQTPSNYRSWAWSRVISDGHNKGFAPKDNRGLAAMLAAIAEPVTGTGIWQSKWLDGFAQTIEPYKELGYIIGRVFRESVTDLSSQLDSAEQEQVEKMRAVMNKNNELKGLTKGKGEGLRKVATPENKSESSVSSLEEGGSNHEDDSGDEFSE